MKILYRYVVTSYVKKLLWAILAAITVFIVVNLVEQLDKFIDSKVPALVVIRFYYLFVPYIVYLIFPVATLLATLFTIGGIAISCRRAPTPDPTTSAVGPGMGRPASGSCPRVEPSGLARPDLVWRIQPVGLPVMVASAGLDRAAATY